MYEVGQTRQPRGGHDQGGSQLERLTGRELGGRRMGNDFSSRYRTDGELASIFFDKADWLIHRPRGLPPRHAGSLYDALEASSGVPTAVLTLSPAEDIIIFR